MRSNIINILIILSLVSIAVVAGCIGQYTTPTNEVNYSDNVSLGEIVFCKTSPNLADESLCDRIGSTTIKSLSYLAAKSTNFSTVEGNWSATCYTNVTDENGTTVLSGASTAMSVKSDRRMLCQVPIDAKTMTEGNYNVLFKVRDNNNYRMVQTDADFKVQH
ncbi:MAG: hypothetical protein HY831_04860 [Candidatus Aenigmarchaeota archaeon]|nr:hypothetical protein [Candidatus Aenigmarchaeota archaeon]